MGIVTVDPDGTVEEWSSLVNPGQRIPPFIEALTGISNAMVEEARLEKSEHGLWPVTEGWFVVNVRDAAWLTEQGAPPVLVHALLAETGRGNRLAPKDVSPRRL